MNTLFALHLMAAIPDSWDRVPFMEFSCVDQKSAPTGSDVFSPPLDLKDGVVRLAGGGATGGGWGVRLADDVLERAERRLARL